MRRPFFFTLILLAAIALMTACSSTEETSPTALSFEKRDPRGPIWDLDSYLKSVAISFDEVEWDDGTTFTVNRAQGDTLSIVPHGYPEDLPVIISFEADPNAGSDGRPLNRNCTIFFPKPPRDSQYLDIFGDNVIFRTKGFPKEPGSQVRLEIPIPEWFDPAGIQSTMNTYTLYTPSGVSSATAINVNSFKFKPPSNKPVYFSLSNYLGIGEIDDLTDTVFDDVLVDDE